MNRKRPVIWVIAALCLAIYAYCLHTYLMPFDTSDVFTSIDMISGCLTPVLVGFIISLLIALIPWKQRTYKSRFSIIFPSGLVVICLLLAFAFYSRGPHYRAVKTEPGTDCLSVKEGLFRTTYFLIERKGNVQIETNIETKETDTLMVRWISACEYELSSATTDAVKVKIVSVDAEGYECHALVKGRTTKRFKVMRRGQ